MLEQSPTTYCELFASSRQYVFLDFEGFDYFHPFARLRHLAIYPYALLNRKIFCEKLVFFTGSVQAMMGVLIRDAHLDLPWIPQTMY